MRIIDVTPLKKGIFTDQLSYFSKVDIKAGSLVSVMVRNKVTPALVLKSTDATKMKSKIRSSDFSLKKIVNILQPNFLLPEFIEAGFEIANFYAKHHPEVFKSLLPKAALVQTAKRKLPPISKSNKTGSSFALQKPDQDRLTFYKEIIEEAFRKKESVFITLPSHLEVEHVFNLLKKDFADRIFKFHTQLSNKKISQLWQEALTHKGPVVIIATPIFLSLPKADIKVYICDRENSRLYKQLTRPYIDWRRFIHLLAGKRQATLIFGDEILRAETLHKINNKKLELLRPLDYQGPKHLKQKLVELKKNLSQPFYHLADEITAAITHNLNAGKKTLLITGRRGLHSSIVCSDCGQIAFCPNCQSPFVLHKTGGKNTFTCHKCQLKTPATDKCQNCKGYRLKTLGSGIESIAEEIKEKVKIEPILLDSDRAKTKTVAKKIAKTFLTENHSLLVGTEMALYYIHEEVDTVIVAGIDNLFTIPSFRTSERIINLIARSRRLAKDNFYLQTRNPAESAYRSIITGELPEFFENELADRKTLRYPPFYTLIKITVEGEENAVNKNTEILAEDFKDWSPDVFSAFTPVVRNKHQKRVIIRVKQEDWPDQKLVLKLKNLPPQFAVDVEPEEIM